MSEDGPSAPTCSRCGKLSVYYVCRACATPAELAKTFMGTSRKKSVKLPYYPAID